MARQILNPNSLAPNDKLGDTPFNYTAKLNSMTDELYGLTEQSGFLFISQESDFPLQDATTITLGAGVNHFITADISTAKRFIIQDTALLTAYNFFSPTLTYTGSGAMFTSSSVSFIIRDIQLNAPNATQGFSCVDSTTNTKIINLTSVVFLNLAKWGTFETYLSLVMDNCGTFLATGEGGITTVGTGWNVFSCMRFAINSTSSSFVAIDLGTSVHTFLDFEDFICIAPSGGIGFKGATNNANMLSGSTAGINGSTFIGGMTAFLSGLSSDDIRYNYQSNANIPDTNPDCLISMTSNATSTTVSGSTPALVAGTWNTVERESHFTATTAGRAVYNGERTLVGPVTVSITVEPASGNNKDISAYLAVDGTFIANSKTTVRVDNANPKTISIPWQVEFSLNTFVEIYVSNDTDDVAVTGTSAILRVR